MSFTRFFFKCRFFMTGQYGVKSVTNWKFETWNEPDLKVYNLLNFTIKGLTYEALIDSSFH